MLLSHLSINLSYFIVQAIDFYINYVVFIFHFKIAELNLQFIFEIYLISSSVTKFHSVQGLFDFRAEEL